MAVHWICVVVCPQTLFCAFVSVSFVLSSEVRIIKFIGSSFDGRLPILVACHMYTASSALFGGIRWQINVLLLLF